MLKAKIFYCTEIGGFSYVPCNIKCPEIVSTPRKFGLHCGSCSVIYIIRYNDIYAAAAITNKAV
jgi:hypothetical protein